MKKERFKSINNVLFVIKHIYLWKKSIFISIALYSIFYAISPFIWIYVPKLLIDELMGEANIQTIVQILGISLILASIIGFLTEYLQGDFRMKMNAIRYNFIHMLSEKAMTMDFPYTEDPNTLNEINIAQRTIQNPNGGIGVVILKLFSIFGSIIAFLGFATIIFNLSPIILGILIISILISYFAMIKAKNYERSRKDELSDEERKSHYASSILSDFQYGKDIRAYGLKDLLFSKKLKSDSKYINIVRDIQNYIFKAAFIDSLLIFIREALIYSYLIYRLIYKGLTMGDFVLYSMAMRNFAIWMETTMRDLAIIRIESLYISDYRKFLNKEDRKPNPNPKEIPKCRNFEIEFRNISFKYPHSNRYIFKDFSLRIKPGKKLAIVGINGAGKTTLVKLLTKLYQPTSGEILINGININDYDDNEYLDLFSVVFQDIRLFAFNIKENITFQDVNIDQNKLKKAIKQAGIEEKINSLEKGIFTNMMKVLDEDGIELSGGENQKIAMARALYKDGEIVIMDEPTASLDALAEYKLYKSFDELIKNKTAIYISHRLSSTRFCDVIAYIENGELKEYGTHEELMRLGNLYANMFNIQGRYYKEDEAYA